jgi:ring-1,2-phenylacetyl-CoA epoxidase subunit PaaD
MDHENPSTGAREFTREEIWRALGEVVDPEIPVISLVDLGVIRDVKLRPHGRVQVIMTPTYSGCPAQQVMRMAVIEKLAALGVDRPQVKISLSPPWTTDWISAEGRAKLAAFGLSPPPVHRHKVEEALLAPARCPYCGSQHTELRNPFGPTLCRSLHYCKVCQEPFEHFKPL